MATNADFVTWLTGDQRLGTAPDRKRDLAPASAVRYAVSVSESGESAAGDSSWRSAKP